MHMKDGRAVDARQACNDLLVNVFDRRTGAPLFTTKDKQKALDHLEPLLKVPYHLSPGWLRIDPTFAPLRSEPRFQRMVQSAN